VTGRLALARAGHPGLISLGPWLRCPSTFHLCGAAVGSSRKESARIISGLFDASIEVFAKRGYRATTVDHIVAASQITVGTFYALFDGKEDCFLRICDQILDESQEQILAQVPPATPWPAQAAMALRALVDLIAAEPFRARVVLVESQTAGARVLARYQATIETVIPTLRKGRRESPAAGRLSGTLEEAIIGGVVWPSAAAAAE
jgi:AcrR family transcriptional regulator